MCLRLSEVVTVAPVGLESVLIEKALDSTVQTSLVGVPGLSDGPTHSLVPTEPEQALPSQANAHQQQAGAEH